MVSSACRGVCSTMSPKSNSRVLNLDRTKDYTLPLQVETSVEYDLPSHIYPPKGSEPILMIHPAFITPVRARKVPVTSHSQPQSVRDVRPLSSLQVHGSQQLSKSVSKISQSKGYCSCGNPHCTSTSSRSNSSVRSSQQQSSVLSSRQIPQTTENILYSAVKNNIQSTDLKQQQKQLQQQRQQQKVQIQKQIQQAQQQKQIHLQQQHLQQVQLQLQERAKLHAQQLQQLQSQQQQQQHQQHQHQKSLTPQSTLSRQQQQQQQSSSDPLMAWNRCQGPCCQPRIGAMPPSVAEFLPPGLPPSLLARTPTRGPAGGSPKLRARTRRGLSVANTVNLPEYLGSARSSRTSSVGGLVGGSGHAHSRPRSSSMLAATPAPITAHQVASALDVVRTHVLTPRSLFASQQQKQQLQNSLNSSSSSTTSSSSSLLSTVGQSRDSGCSISTEVAATTTNPFSSNENAVTGKNVEWSWSVVDSGFCTPVDLSEDQVMEAFDPSGPAIASYTPVSSAAQPTHKESLHWMNEFSAPLTSSSSSSSLSGIHNSFLPPSNPHYIPQPIWNLAY